MSRWMGVAGWAAALTCAGAAVIAGIQLDGYSHALHPLALLGGRGVPGAAAFNLFGFVVPGVLAALVSWGLYRALPAAAGWWPRIGARLLLVSALAFAAQGLLPLDPQDLEGPESGLHASAWMVWWTAFAAGALLSATGARRTRIATIAAACVVLAMMLIPASVLAPVLAQRIAFAAWLLWLALVPRAASAVAELERQDHGGQGESGDVGQDHRP